MKYKLVTLSPVHIGSGEQISNWSYAYENGKIKIYSFDKVVRSLKDNHQKLLNLTAQIERNPLNKSLGDILSSFRINVEPEYTVDFKGEIKRQRFDRNTRQNITEYKPIWEFIKQNGKVYIPGTEIKGAIRTAVFYKILKDKFKEDEKLKQKFLKEYENCINVKDYRDEREKKKKIQNEFKKMSSRWENFAFRGDFYENDAKKDILKVFLISDSDLKNPEEVLTIKDITALGVSRHFEEPHELVKAGSEFIVDLRVPFHEEHRKIFPQTYKYLGLKKIRESCSDFAIASINADIKYFKKTSQLNPEEKSRIINKLEQRKKLAESGVEKGYILIRLGKHQGFLSTTINLLVKELDKELYSKAYKYLVHKGYEEFPNKSRKLTIDNELLGWCVLLAAG